MYSTGAQVTFVSETRSSKCTSTQLNARFITSASFVVPSNGLSGGLWLLWSQDVYLSIKFSNSNIILALAVHIPESPNGGRAPWSSVSKKKLNPQIFVSKNSAKNQSCRQHIDPPLWNFSSTNSYYYELHKKDKLVKFQNFMTMHCRILFTDSDLPICLFSPDRNTRYLVMKIFTMVYQCSIYNYDFFQNFS